LTGEYNIGGGAVQRSGAPGEERGGVQ
jgi:hypothetical protein